MLGITGRLQDAGHGVVHDQTAKAGKVDAQIKTG